ncbi:diguanylate cyclase (GGDEF)-like protein [Granulicella aggregans]|uniref:Diguanylate cyclase (GGDEF)-like protein n=1 Tax=Granulicella aggregans TaxID=474949 RepID=A0A7W7ZCE5_9BACT|nr:diguanylate cyclase (GGDEF)-like protein [Granulicella aggregans]
MNRTLTLGLASLCIAFLPQTVQGEERSSRGRPGPDLNSITTALEAHNLLATEAARGREIKLRGVVTYSDVHQDRRRAFFFLHDASGSIFVTLPSESVPIPPGTLVSVKGQSALGDYAPIISHPQVEEIGHAPLPALAPSVSLTRLLTGEEDGQWVEVEGVVRSVYEDDFNVLIQLAMRDGVLSVTLPRKLSSNYKGLVDSRVKIHGNAAPMFNGDRQMIGARLFTPDTPQIEIIEPGPANPFEVPARQVGMLSRFNPMSSLPRRVHVQGRVTLMWPRSLLCVQDATHGICAQTTLTTPIALGTVADVVGFVETVGSVPSLTDAVFKAAQRAHGEAPKLATPSRVDAETALQSSFGSELIEVDAELIGRNPAAADTTLILSSGGFVFEAILPRSLDGDASKALRIGSRLRVTGICSIQIDDQRSARQGGPAARKSFRILMRSPGDVLLLSAPSWWTPSHTLIVLTAILTATLLVLGWVIVLTGKLRRQKGLIQDSEEQFRHLAQHDSLTGLPTRALLRDRLTIAIERARRSQTGIGLLMLDLDRFKQINDSLGHHAGDQALKVSARRICQSVRASDTVARISGDEFIVLITDLNDPKEVELVAAKIVSTLSAPFRVGNREVPLSASVGVCMAFGDALEADSLMKMADTAMYHAKARGRNCFQIYSADMDQATKTYQRLRSGLERALAANEFEIHYQPLVDFKTRELTGFEALLRWRSQELGLVMPTEFIPVAEESGLIVSIGEWVLRQACHEIGLLETQLGRRFLLAVNLSPRQIQQFGLPEMVSRCLEESRRDPESIELEITESILMNDSSSTQNSLIEMRGMGVRLAIDDFGVGFSSLSYITRFSIDRIKIDRSFVMKCMTEDTSLAVIRAMVAMAHGLSMTVVAEGVETAEEFHFLGFEGCDTAQGYYLSRPVPAAELIPLVHRLDDWAGTQTLTAKAV